MKQVFPVGPRAVVALAALAFVAHGGCSTGTPVERGQRVYAGHCAVCHGEHGDGKGEAAARFATRPRDFTKGTFKFRSTASGQLPLDEDLVRSVSGGVPGTAMVPQDHLRSRDVQDVVAYIKTFSPRFAALTDPPKRAEIPAATPSNEDSISNGRRMYEDAGCPICHGREGRGDGSSARDLSSKPPDFTRLPRKSGPTAADLARTIWTGLDGSPMPSFSGDLKPQELWDVVYFIESLSKGEASPAMSPDEKAGWETEKRTPPRS